MASAIHVARALRDVLLELHDSVAETEATCVTCGVRFRDNLDAERLRLVLLSRVQSDVGLSMALAHLADAMIDVLERGEAAA